MALDPKHTALFKVKRLVHDEYVSLQDKRRYERKRTGINSLVEEVIENCWDGIWQACNGR